MKNIIKQIKKDQSRETREILKTAIEIFLGDEIAPKNAKDCILGNTIILEKYPEENIPQHYPAKYAPATRNSKRVYFLENGQWCKLPNRLKKLLPVNDTH